jgi:hypothetical protein
MPRALKAATTNWRTTTTGVIAAVVAILDGVAAMVDGDATTNPDFVMILAVIVAAIGLIRARDDVVTSDVLKREGVV